MKVWFDLRFGLIEGLVWFSQRVGLLEGLVKVWFGLFWFKFRFGLLEGLVWFGWFLVCFCLLEDLV